MHALKITHTLARVHTNTQALRPSHFAKLLHCAKPRAVGAYGCKNSAKAGGGRLQAFRKV